MGDKRIYVERRPEGDYAVRKPGSERASEVTRTQADAIERAREISIRRAGSRTSGGGRSATVCDIDF